MACIDNAMRALFLLALFCVVHGEKAKSKDNDAKASGPGGSFDITKLGASGNGKTDSTKAVQEAWASACGGTGKQTILIPKGDFLVGPLNFTGPCKGDVTIQVNGNLLATTDLSQYKDHGNWIEILRVDNLVITGKGKLDGQGPAVWSKNSCVKKYDCKILPNSLVMDFVNNGEVSGITLLNSKFFHMNMYKCKDMLIKDVNVTAPGDSPNTDGIHMGDSSGVTITNTVIGVGDDCISIGPGTSKVNITGVTCGPGHGISIGSLGRYKDEKDVTDINVKDCTLKKTANGVRIKAYEDAASVLTASKIHYENIKMEDSGYPIIIDMKYCPNKLCTANGASKVTVKDVTFKNITGTSSTPEAVNLLCTAKIPCTGVTMDDVNIKYSGTNNKTMAVCKNAKGSAKGCLKELACF
uniref:Exopolygalacturonase n=1 Tax=Zea mays TaxID=4577 RepID=PGLR3_MAIZE|nr:RecName: Full=Exopolygalacturonase; Short=ExoPG; AltName: Full=Galacturan 1,4-alpha-galacturonidase; AltName: Full=Pectinase; Flags: Precursor [Zea mays]CAA47052.1 polygalacturonase [Zea mays]